MDFIRPVQAVIPGVQGRILAVLSTTTAELSLSTIARLANVSVAQASRVLPALIDIGMVERRDVPPSALFRLVRENVAAQAVLALAGARDSVLAQIGNHAAHIAPPPISVTVFGSLARGDAGVDADVDVVVVGPASIDEDDERWHDSVEQFRQNVRLLTGNEVDILEVSDGAVRDKVREPSELWRDVLRDGVTVFGAPVDALQQHIDA